MNLRDYAAGQPCLIVEDGVCNGNTETTVLAHWRQVGISGGGMKAPDLLAAFACSACHDFVDGRSHFHVNRAVRELAHLRGIMRTQSLLIERGLVTW